MGEPLVHAPACLISPAMLDFALVAAGEPAELEFTITNTGKGPLVGAVTESCAEFTIVSGGGAYELEPEQERIVTVRYAAPDTGSHVCDIQLGTSACATIRAVGETVVPVAGAACTIVPAALDFGAVASGISVDDTLRIVNDGAFTFGGTLALTCQDYSIMEGEGPFELPPGEILMVIIRFEPTENGVRPCNISTGVNCDDVSVTGSGSGFPTVSYASDVQPLFDGRCIAARCHAGTGPAGGLLLTSSASYAQIVDVDSRSYPAKRVASGDANASVLYHKVANTLVWGGRMPPSGPALTTQQQEIIRVWIQEGALNN